MLWVDRFGNAQLNVGPDDLAGWGDVVRLSWGEEVRTAHRVATYDEIGAGAIGLVLDSYGLLAVALMRRSAAGELGLGAGRRGDAVGAVGGPRRRHHGAGGAPGPRPAARIGSRPVRPATTLALALLLVVIVVAGVASLVLMG